MAMARTMSALGTYIAANECLRREVRGSSDDEGTSERTEPLMGGNERRGKNEGPRR